MKHASPYLFLAACLYVAYTDQQTPRSAPPPAVRTRPAVLSNHSVDAHKMVDAQPAERRAVDSKVHEAEQRVTFVAAQPTPDCQCEACDCDQCHCKPGYKCDSNSCTLVPESSGQGAAGRGQKEETSTADDYRGIHWVTKAEAEASPKPDFWHVTAPNLADCHWCVVAERLLQSPEVVKASRQFDCVRTTRVSGRSVPYPTDVFCSASRYWLVSGCPSDAASYAQRLTDCLAIVQPTPDLAPPPAETHQPAESAARPERSVVAGRTLLPLGRAKWQPRSRLR